MAERYPGGVISKTPPTVTPPAPIGGGLPTPEGGSASGVWTLDTVLEYEKAGAWPKPLLPRELYAWGNNSSGQLGDGTVVNKSSPVQVGALINWAQVSAGTSFSPAIKTDGTLWAWGVNGSGQLGDNTIILRSSPIQVGALTNWAQVAAGSGHTVAITTGGELYAWGVNTNGQLGDGTVVLRSSPVQVGALTNWAQVSGGGIHTAAVKTDGTMWTWGENDAGQLGLNISPAIDRSSPVQVGALTNWVQVSAGNKITAAVTTAGELYAWGDNFQGQVGDGTTVDKSSPVQIGALTNWARASAAAGSFTAALKINNTLWTWGTNGNGQLGHGQLVTVSSPVQVGALTNWAQVSAGGNHTAAVKTDGTLWAWGDNSPNGQLGDGTVTDRSSPVQIGALTNWVQVSAGGASNTLATTKG